MVRLVLIAFSGIGPPKIFLKPSFLRCFDTYQAVTNSSGVDLVFFAMVIFIKSGILERLTFSPFVALFKRNLQFTQRMKG